MKDKFEEHACDFKNESERQEEYDEGALDVEENINKDIKD